ALADQRQGLAAADAERDVIDRAHVAYDAAQQAAPDREPFAQALDLEDGRRGGGRLAHGAHDDGSSRVGTGAVAPLTLPWCRKQAASRRAPSATAAGSRWSHSPAIASGQRGWK